MRPRVLAVIPARAGSKGLPGKCVAALAGRPLIEHTILHARAARRCDAVCVTTDSPDAASVARTHGVFVVDRPAELATDAAPVDAALRHAVEAFERAHAEFTADVIVLLYGNVPVRAPGIIDRAIAHLIGSGADSVRTVAAIGKHHPDWLHRLTDDRMTPFRANLVHRRQDLEPLYYHDAAVVAVKRAALYAPPSGPDDHHAFFGRDRRAIVQPPEATVDVDTALDLRIAEAILKHQAAQTGAPSAIRIGRREIGPGQGVFIIAEAGVNHDGDLSAAIALVEAAAAAGADAVKFQAFRADRLVSRDAAPCDYQRGHAQAATQHEMLRRLELDRAAFEKLKQAADRCGIEFLATPFGVEELRMLVSLGAAAIKLASSDITNVPLLQAAAQSGLPVIASTGAAELDEVRGATAILVGDKRRGVETGHWAPGTGHSLTQSAILLHCVSRYPTPLADANLAAMVTLRREFDLPVGFSDHTVEVQTGALAVAAGAVVLEKHLTLDRAAAGPDHFFSLTPADFAEYVRVARTACAALGDGRVSCGTSQLEVRRLARRSIIATAHIPRGTTLTAAQLDAQRPGGGIDPMHWDRLIGRVAATDISPGTRLEWSMLASPST